jgi:hypothetical protein
MLRELARDNGETHIEYSQICNKYIPEKLRNNTRRIGNQSWHTPIFTKKYCYKVPPAMVDSRQTIF